MKSACKNCKDYHKLVLRMQKELDKQYKINRAWQKAAQLKFEFEFSLN